MKISFKRISSLLVLISALLLPDLAIAEDISIVSFVSEHYIVSMIVSFIILVMMFTILHMMRLNKNIEATKLELEDEINIRERAESVLTTLAQQSLNYSKDESFFEDCLVSLTELFDAKFAFIGLFGNPEKTKIKTYTVLVGGHMVENFEYELAGTPCQDVIDLRQELIEKDAGLRYPEDELLIKMEVESYFGAPLISPEGAMMGLVALMDTCPMKPESSIRDILKIYANRIAMEIKRKGEEKELQSMAIKLSYQASHDALTTLVNRREFEKRMTSALSSAKSNQACHALCYLDLDQFKVINDTCGHLAGDELLKILANRLSEVVRGSDTLARLGGDEFGLLLLDCPIERAEFLSNKLLKSIKDFRFSWKDSVFEIGASIGLVAITASSRDIYEVLQSADSACYVAKDNGRNRVHVYKEDDLAVASHQGEMRWISEITQALDNDDFLLYRQAIQASDKTELYSEHYEFLIRMKNKDGEVLLPGSFISAAERYNLMYSIDQWVIEKSFSFLQQQYSKEELSSHKILYAINLSGISIGNENLPEFIEKMVDKYDIAPQAICFEITETAAISNFSHATSFIESMKRKGFCFALDDFGTGLCSYAYLRNLPVNYLKIDGRFISGIFDDPMNKAIIESIVHVAKVMQVHTIAEWVEDEKILNELKSMNVNYVQGYHIGMPEQVPELKS